MVNQSCDGFGPYQLLFWMPEQFLPYPSRLQTPWLDATGLASDAGIEAAARFELK